nr:hypothetical protein [Tanacetum cinerariifolium]
MIAILEKSKHNIDFHQIVDFIEASHIRIKTMNEGTKILATVDGKPRTIFESSIRRNLKLNDEERISSLPDAELFENLALMGYNILPNQIFTFQKGRTVPLFATMLVTQGEGSAIPTEPYHTPSPQEQQSSHHDLSSPSHSTATTKPIPIVLPTEIPTLRQYSRRATRIAQFKALSLTSALPHESTPRVNSVDADEGSMQQKLYELMDLCTGLQRQQTQMAAKIKDQDLEISGLKARVKILKGKDRGRQEPQEDALIKGRSMEIGEEVRVERSTKLGSNNTEEMVNILSSMEAANILTSEVAAVNVSPVAEVLTVGVPTVSGLFPTVNAIFTTASMVTPYSRRPRGISTKDKGKEKVVEYKEPKKKNLQEQIDAQVAKEIEEEIMMIKGLDRSNEMIAKHLQEFEQAAADLSIGEKIELINELVKYQDHHAKILKYQAQQSKPLSKKEQKEFYMLGGHTAVYQFFVDMLKQLNKEDLHQLWALVKETLSIRHALRDREKELWVELKRLFEPDFEDYLWIHTQNLMHDPLD